MIRSRALRNAILPALAALLALGSLRAFAVFQVSAAAEKSKAKYLAALEKSQEKYSEAAELHFGAHLKELETVLDAETKAGRLDVAVAVRDELQRLKSEGAPVYAEVPPTSLRIATARLVGTWHVAFPGGVTRTYIVDGKGGVRFVDEKRVAKLKGQPKELLVDFDDGKIERWNLADGRLFVEHWDPKAGYPNKQPTAISVGTKLSN